MAMTAAEKQRFKDLEQLLESAKELAEITQIRLDEIFEQRHQLKSELHATRGALDRTEIELRALSAENNLMKGYINCMQGLTPDGKGWDEQSNSDQSAPRKPVNREGSWTINRDSRKDG